MEGTRDRLVSCARRMLAEEGVEALTLRAIGWRTSRATGKGGSGSGPLLL